jgi:hypothetical protein
MTFQATTAAQLASLAALVLVFPEPASGGIDPASYQHVKVIHGYTNGRAAVSSCARRAPRLSPRVRQQQGCSTA